MIFIKKILILFGGNSFEHEISCNSVNYVIKNISKKDFKFELVGIDYENNWYKVDSNKIITKKWLKEKKEKISNIFDYIDKFDVVLPVIHGNIGEDGKLAALFELNNTKYVGCNSYSSLICYDKMLTKLILEKYNISQVPYIIYNENINLNNISYPVIIKPSKCGSSIGINIANNIKEAKKEINNALKYDNSVIIEKYIEHKKEIECAILQNKNKLIVSNIGEILNDGNFYDYKAKYKTKIKTDLSSLDYKTKKEIKDCAKKIFKILKCKDLSRVDFLYDLDSNKWYFNEINTMPGFTEISMFPKLINEKGINAKKLISILINNK